MEITPEARERMFADADAQEAQANVLAEQAGQLLAQSNAMIAAAEDSRTWASEAQLTEPDPPPPPPPPPDPIPVSVSIEDVAIDPDTGRLTWTADTEGPVVELRWGISSVGLLGADDDPEDGKEYAYDPIGDYAGHLWATVLDADGIEYLDAPAVPVAWEAEAPTIPPPPPPPPADEVIDLSVVDGTNLWRPSNNDPATPMVVLHPGSCPQLPSEPGYRLTLEDGERASFDPPQNERDHLQGPSPFVANTDYCFVFAIRVLSVAPPLSGDWGWHDLGLQIHSADQSGVSPFAFGVDPYTGGYTLSIRTTATSTSSNQRWAPASSTRQPVIGVWEYVRILFRSGNDGLAELFIGEDLIGSWSGQINNPLGQIKVQLYRRYLFTGRDQVEFVGMHAYRGGLRPLPSGFVS